LEVLCISDIRNQKKIITGGMDNLIKLWDYKTYQCLWTFDGHTGYINDLVILNGLKLASASKDKTIKIWDMADFCCLKTLYGHSESVTCLYYNSAVLLSGSWDRNVKVWNLKDLICAETIQLNSLVYCLTYSIDQQRKFIGIDNQITII
jgi:WD40 repeat protein